MQPAQLFVLAIGFGLENGGHTPVHHLFALASLLIVFKVPGRAWWRREDGPQARIGGDDGAARPAARDRASCLRCLKVCGDLPRGGAPLCAWRLEGPEPAQAHPRRDRSRGDDDPAVRLLEPGSRAIRSLLPDPSRAYRGRPGGAARALPCMPPAPGRQASGYDPQGAGLYVAVVLERSRSSALLPPVAGNRSRQGRSSSQASWSALSARPAWRPAPTSISRSRSMGERSIPSLGWPLNNLGRRCERTAPTLQTIKRR